MSVASVVVWKEKAEPHGAVLHDLVGVEDTWELVEGVPRAATFPADATFALHPDFPRHLVLTDALINRYLVIVGSARLRAFLEYRSLRGVEYLPVTVLDHRGRAVSEQYCIIHPIDPVDCLDLPACEPQWSRVDPETIQRVERLVVDPARLEEGRELFRPKFYCDVVLLRRALAQAIEAAGFTGMRFAELPDGR